MSGNHNHNHVSQNIRIAFFLNLSFTIVEIIGGFFTNSIAILSDALHDLGDSLSLGLAWYLEKLSLKKPDRRFSFGYRRLSLLSALINGIILIAGSVFILSEAIPRLLVPEPVNVVGMFYLSILGMVVNGVSVLRLRGGTTLNERVVTWHLIEDVLGWAAIFVISIVMYFWPVTILDTILSLLITLFVLWNVLKRLKETIVIFLQAVPPGIDIDRLEADLVQLEAVSSVHHTHIWSLDGEKHIASIHIVVNNNWDYSKAVSFKQTVRNIFSKFKIEHVTIELENKSEVCEMIDC
ncbi:MAG: cation transporter [Candidatus Marinimicrobia bacterium]|nr:cation transporter [Candidatus Neomarinimicrobiota bacterium]